MVGKELKPRFQPQLIEIGERVLSTHGFRSDLFLDHLEAHQTRKGKGQWCDLACAARTVAGGQATPTAKKQMRLRVAGLFRFLLSQGKFMTIEYGGTRGQITRMKLFDPNTATELERKYAEYQLERMKTRGEIQQSTYERAQAIVVLG